MKDVTTAREALMAELLLDVDKLVSRIEAVDSDLAHKIEQATKDAINQTLLSTKLNLQSVVTEQEQRLTEAGRHAAAMIGNQLNSGICHIVTANATLESKARKLLLILFSLSLIAGTLGGIIGANLS